MQFKIEIKHRWTGKVLFAWTGEADSEAKAKGEAVKAALESRADLRGADLTGQGGSDAW